VTKALTIEQFTEKAIDKHKLKYVYDKVKYINTHTKVNIYCKKCKKYFSQTPMSHLVGCIGCKYCSMQKKSNISRDKRKILYKKYIQKAKCKFGNKFDYSKIDYTKKIEEKNNIICLTHGNYKTTFMNHINSPTGCISCTNESTKYNQLTTNDFVKRAKEKYGNKFNLDYVVYKNSHKKVKIICPIHGEFKTSPTVFLSLRIKYGCNKCGNIKTGKNLSKGLNEFIIEANKKYNNKFNYSLIKNYKNINQKSEIICPKHGIFSQRLQDHLRAKYGCPKCYMDEKGKSRKKYNTNSFIKEAKKIWGNKINYEKTKYVRSSYSSTFICKKHNLEYKQYAENHIKGMNGCYKCVKENRKGGVFFQNKNAFFYVLKLYNFQKIINNQTVIDFDTIGIKIGITHNLKERLQKFKRKTKGDLKLLFVYEGLDLDIFNIEKKLRKKFFNNISRVNVDYYIDKKLMKYGFSETIQYSKKKINTILKYCDNDIKLNKCNLKKKQTLEIF